MNSTHIETHGPIYRMTVYTNNYIHILSMSSKKKDQLSAETKDDS